MVGKYCGCRENWQNGLQMKHLLSGLKSSFGNKVSLHLFILFEQKYSLSMGWR